jgi:hypothetical protein
MKESAAMEQRRRRDYSSEERRGRECPVDDRARSSSVDRRTRDVLGERKQDNSMDSNIHSATWQNKARSSPVPSPNPKPMANNSRSNDSHRSATRTPEKSTWQATPEKANRQAASEEQQPLSKEKDSTKTDEKRNVAKLVAKLNSVSRENPAEALAVIDSILRQESRSSSGEPEEPARGTPGEAAKRESPTPVESLSDDDDDSSGETSVSSITNPTYQSVKPYHDQVKVLSQNPFAPDNSFPNPFPSKESSANPFSPSTSSFRRPRPSALQNYASATPQENSIFPKEGTMSKAKERRQQLKEFPPPTTIKVKESLTPSATVHLQSSLRNNQVEREQVATAPAPKKLDKFISNTEELAAKIRVWDEMSNGPNKSKACDSGKYEADETQETHEPEQAVFPVFPRLPAPPKVPSRRLHPWDDEIPARHEKVNTKDTSMDGEMGFETVMTERGPDGFKEPCPFDSAQDCLASAIKFGRSNSTPAVSNDFFNDTFEAEPSDFFAQAPSGGWEVAPRMTPQQHENAQKSSDDFDAAWVSMPSSSFFLEEQAGKATRTERPPPPKSGPVDLDISYDTATTIPQKQKHDFPSWANDDSLNRSGEHGAIEVCLLDDDTRNAHESREERSAAPSASGSASTANEAKSTPKRRGFLRAFIRKEKKKAAGAASSQGVSQPSVGAQSLPLPKHQQPVLPIPPSRAGFDPQEMPPPLGRETARNSKNRPPRSRSNSLERFRTASMAQKFSRVMKLYEHD